MSNKKKEEKEVTMSKQISNLQKRIDDKVDIAEKKVEKILTNLEKETGIVIDKLYFDVNDDEAETISIEIKYKSVASKKDDDDDWDEDDDDDKPDERPLRSFLKKRKKERG